MTNGLTRCANRLLTLLGLLDVLFGVLDICVVPALHKGVGLNVIEAMACGKAVISTGGDTVYGIIRLLDDPAHRKAMVEAADEVVRERYSLRASVNTLLSFYGRCIERTENA